MDFFNGSGDWHILENGKDVVSRWFSGGVKDAAKDAGEEVMTKLMAALEEAMKMGNPKALSFAKNLRRMGIMGVPESLGFAVVAITSLDACAQANPADFADIIKTIGMVEGLSLGSSTTYSWDSMNRLVGLVTANGVSSYEYRADGIRTHKTVGTTNTEYYHDDSTHFEDAVISGSSVTASRYGLGARGIDYIEKGVGTTTSRQQMSFSTIGFPIYDIHGSMIATLTRYGTNNYQVNDKRSYDAWGSIRSGNTTGDPANGYCGNIGHQHDDESGLIYVRARYYDPTSARFMSEDSSRNGGNWFAYCSDDPVNRVDADGCRDWIKIGLEGFLTLAGNVMMAQGISALGRGVQIQQGVAMITRALIVLTLAYAVACTSNWHASAIICAVGYVINSWINSACAALAVGEKTQAALACTAVFAYTMEITREIINIMIDDFNS